LYAPRHSRNTYVDLTTGDRRLAFHARPRRHGIAGWQSIGGPQRSDLSSVTQDGYRAPRSSRRTLDRYPLNLLGWIILAALRCRFPRTHRRERSAFADSAGRLTDQSDQRLGQGQAPYRFPRDLRHSAREIASVRLHAQSARHLERRFLRIVPEQRSCLALRDM